MNSKTKKAFIVTVCALLNLAIVPFTVGAQSNQEITLTIAPFYDVTEPTALTIPRTFMNPAGDTTIYSAFSPSDIASQIRVTDLRNNGGFTVDLSIENFVSGVNVIPYTNVGIVTLANATLPDTVDTLSSGPWTNTPPGTDSQTVFSSLDCDWDFISSFATSCNSFFQNFTGSGPVSNPQIIIDGSTPTGAGRVGEYWVALGLRLLVPQGTPAGTYSSIFTFTIL